MSRAAFPSPTRSCSARSPSFPLLPPHGELLSPYHWKLTLTIEPLQVLCLALHHLDTDVQTSLGLSVAEAAGLARTMFDAAETTLWASDFVGSHSLAHLSGIVMMSVYQLAAADQASALWSLLGLAVRIGQSLGLSRLGEETISRRDRWPGPWKSFARRETGRRVWWSLVRSELRVS